MLLHESTDVKPDEDELTASTASTREKKVLNDQGDDEDEFEDAQSVSYSA